MVFLLVTALVAAVVISLVASVLRWIVKKVAPERVASLGHATTTASVVAVTTALYVFVMTRPAIVGPYEQWTFENIGGQVFGGVLAAGVMIWLGTTSDS